MISPGQEFWDQCGALNIQNPRIPGMAKPVALTTVRVPIRRVIDESYPVVIGTNLAETIAERLSESDLVDHEVAIITDENVRPGMAETIRAELTDLAAGFGGQACWRRGNLELPRPCAPVEQPRACRRRPLASTSSSSHRLPGINISRDSRLGSQPAGHHRRRQGHEPERHGAQPVLQWLEQ